MTEKDKTEYLKKLILTSGKQLPDPFTLKDKQSDNIMNLPDISTRHVDTYLIDTPSPYTKESMKAYKSLEAYDYFVCGHVQDCFYNEIHSRCEFCFIKSEVSTRYLKPSFHFSVIWVVKLYTSLTISKVESQQNNIRATLKYITLSFF